VNKRHSLPTLALIAGPTASGKSSLALALAERTGGVVINADASQVYRDLSVITARPSPADESRAEHRLYGYVDGAEAWSAVRWAQDARAVIEEAHGSGRLPILTGGTGLYIRTLLDGIAPVPEIDPAIREEIRAMPVAQSYRALQSLDPAAAGRPPPGDTARIARAREVVRSPGRSLAAWQAERSGGIGDTVTLAPLIVLPDRDLLNGRIEARLDAMFDGGAGEEVAALLARSDVDASAPVRRAIGVEGIAAMLAGELSRDQAMARSALATRRYAKRQYTWFRHQPPADWPRIDNSDTINLEYYFKTEP